MIAIAGTVFSMTLVALSLALSQLGPRLLRNFMRDTANQVVLGTFVATFVYSLLVLRTIRRADEVAFVPHLSVSIGVRLALVSVGVLIYFIHHISVSIQADEVVARVGREPEDGIDRQFPSHLGQPVSASLSAPDQADLPASFAHEARPVGAAADGYLQFIDADGLMDLTCQEDLLLCLERTAAQDVEFSFHQLVEIAVRALSPGINDPFTAIACVVRARRRRRRSPSGRR